MKSHTSTSATKRTFRIKSKDNNIQKTSYDQTQNEKKTNRKKKGANGISLFIPYFFEKTMRKNPIKAPDQKATTAPESNLDNPSNQPNPKANFASPRPIQVPLETSHKKAKGRANNTPHKNSKTDGIWG